MSYAISLTSTLKLAVRVVATTEAQFNSVERVLHYTEHEKGVDGQRAIRDGDGDGDIGGRSKNSEDDIELNNASRANHLTTLQPPDSWPHAGVVEFKNVIMRYRDLPLVLKDVSFRVETNEKIGIAGRTGCGKSSLMVALFRIEELVGGQILIDGVDIARVPVHYLRKKLCIIPQGRIR